MMFRLDEAADWIGARLDGPDVPIYGVGTDSRRGRPGELFVALRGERFDGHQYLAQAEAAGAVAALVSHPIARTLPQLIVEDTRAGLGRLAAAWRRRFPGRVVALTGSNGKTTCKEMIAAILGHNGRVLATRGNLNNDVGMPLTLLQASNEDYLVLEMGANHAGEIAYLSAIANPDVALITNAGRAHLEGFGGPEGVARAKGEIVGGLTDQGALVIPADSPWSALWQGLAGDREVVTFGWTPAAAVRCDPDSVTSTWDDAGFRTRFLARTPWGELPLELALAGRHNVRNALAALAVAGTLGVGLDAIAAGMREVGPVAGRLQPRIGRSGLRLIDDTYNANPDSVQAAIDVLAGIAGRRWLVLGDLAELGAEAAELHGAVGRMAREAGLEHLYSVGPLSRAAAQAFGPGGRSFEDRQALVATLQAEIAPGDLVLVKGSRGAAMETVVQSLTAEAGA